MQINEEEIKHKSRFMQSLHKYDLVNVYYFEDPDVLFFEPVRSINKLKNPVLINKTLKLHLSIDTSNSKLLIFSKIYHEADQIWLS